MNKREEAIEHAKKALEEFETKKRLMNKRTLSGMEEQVIARLEEILKFLEG